MMSGWREAGFFQRPKNFKRGSEDGALRIAGKVYAVLDGVSQDVDAKAPTPLINGLTPGQFARSNGIEALREGVENYTTPEALVGHLTTSHYNACEAKRRNGVPIGRSAYTGAIFVQQAGVIVQVGDCAVMIDGVIYSNEMKVDLRKARIRQGLLERALRNSQTSTELIKNDPTKDLMNRLADWQQEFANSNDQEHGYGVINGSEVPPHLIKVVPVPEGARKILLATDGFPASVLRHDMQAMLDEMGALLERDPLCIKEWLAVRGIQPDGNWPDDATALWLENWLEKEL